MIKSITNLIFVLFFIQIAVAYSAVEMDFDIKTDGEISIKDVVVRDLGILDVEVVSEYNVEFMDSDGNSLGISYFEPKFYVHSTELDIVIPIDFSSVSVVHPYSNRIETFVIKNEDKILLEDNLQKYLCNQNQICDEFESYEFCSDDCRSGYEDGYCDSVEDDLCDPDCVLQLDSDCNSDDGSGKFPLFWIVLIVIAVIAALLIYKFWSKVVGRTENSDEGIREETEREDQYEY